MTKFIQRAKNLFRRARDKLLQPQAKKMIVKGIRRGVDAIIQSLPFNQKTKNLFKKYKNQIDQNGLESLKKIGQNISIGQIKQAVQLVRDPQMTKQQRLKRLKNLSTQVLQQAIVNGQIIKPQAINSLIQQNKIPINQVRKPGTIRKRQPQSMKDQISNIPLLQ